MRHRLSGSDKGHVEVSIHVTHTIEEQNPKNWNVEKMRRDVRK